MQPRSHAATQTPDTAGYRVEETECWVTSHRCSVAKLCPGLDGPRQLWDVRETLMR